MTGEIAPCQTPAVVTPNDPDHRRREEQHRRQRHAPPAAPPRAGLDTPVPSPDPETPSHIGTRINVRV